MMARVSTLRSLQSPYQLRCLAIHIHLPTMWLYPNLSRSIPAIMMHRTREVAFTWLADGTTFTPPPFFFVFHFAESAAFPIHVIWDFVCTCFVGIAGIARQTNRRQARRILLCSCCLSTYPAVKYEYVRVTEHQWK